MDCETVTFYMQLKILWNFIDCHNNYSFVKITSYVMADSCPWLDGDSVFFPGECNQIHAKHFTRCICTHNFMNATHSACAAGTSTSYFLASVSCSGFFYSIRRLMIWNLFHGSAKLLYNQSKRTRAPGIIFHDLELNDDVL